MSVGSVELVTYELPTPDSVAPVIFSNCAAHLSDRSIDARSCAQIEKLSPLDALTARYAGRAIDDVLSELLRRAHIDDAEFGEVIFPAKKNWRKRGKVGGDEVTVVLSPWPKSERK